MKKRYFAESVEIPNKGADMGMILLEQVDYAKEVSIDTPLSTKCTWEYKGYKTFDIVYEVTYHGEDVGSVDLDYIDPVARHKANADKVVKQFENAKSWDVVSDISDTGEAYVMTYYTEDGDIPEEIPEDIYMGKDVDEIKCLRTLVYASKDFWADEILEADSPDDAAVAWHKCIADFIRDNAEDIAQEIEA